jgi:hypothetical protein
MSTRIKYDQLKESPSKKPCRLSTTVNITDLLTGAPDTLDSISLSIGDRILVKDQSTSSQNGIYDVITVGGGSNGVWQRSVDFSVDDDVYDGISLYVTTGTTNSDTLWYLTTPNPIVLGTTNLTFTQFTSGGGSGVYGGSGSVPSETVATTIDNISFLGPAVEASGGFNIGTTSSGGRLHVLDTTEQMRLSYDSTHYTTVHHNDADLLYFKGIGTAESSEVRFLSNATTDHKVRLGYGNDLTKSWNISSINISGKTNFRLTYSTNNPVTLPFMEVQSNGVTKLGMNSVNGADVGIGISASSPSGVGARLDVWDNGIGADDTVTRFRNGNDSDLFNIKSNGALTINNSSLSNADVRIKGGTDANLFFVDASADNVGIGKLNPTGKLHISTIEGDGVIIDALNDGGSFDRNKTPRVIKQGEGETTGTNTTTIATIPLSVDGAALTITGVITAANSANDIAVGGNFMAVVQRVSGSATIINTVDSNIKHNSVGSPSFTVGVSGSNVIVTVTGGGDTFSTKWLVTYEYQIATEPLL